jgi:hypothetical protein
LQLHFGDQLDKLRANGFIEFPSQSPVATSTTYTATAGAGSAIAQGAGAKAMVGSVDTGGGAYIGGSVNTGGGNFIGRDNKPKGS